MRLIILFATLLTSVSAIAQTAAPRPDGGLTISCPSGRTATVIPRGTEVTITVREPNGQTWGTSELPSSGSSDTGNRIGNPTLVAEGVCKM